MPPPYRNYGQCAGTVQRVAPKTYQSFDTRVSFPTFFRGLNRTVPEKMWKHKLTCWLSRIFARVRARMRVCVCARMHVRVWVCAYTSIHACIHACL